MKSEFIFTQKHCFNDKHNDVYKLKITIFAGLDKILNIVKWGNYELRGNLGNNELARKRLEKIHLESLFMRDGQLVVFKNTFSLSKFGNSKNVGKN